MNEKRKKINSSNKMKIWKISICLMLIVKVIKIIINQIYNKMAFQIIKRKKNLKIYLHNRNLPKIKIKINQLKNKRKSLRSCQELEINSE